MWGACFGSLSSPPSPSTHQVLKQAAEACRPPDKEHCRGAGVSYKHSVHE